MSIEDRGQARPLAAGAAGLLAAAAAAEAAARARLAAAAADIFLPPAYRLSDRTRTQVVDLLERLVSAVEEALVQHIAMAQGSARLGAARTSAAWSALERSGLLRQSDLVAHLLRRVEAGSIGAALRRDIDAGPTLIDRLIGDDQRAVAGAAMALLVADARRRVRFDGMPLARTDLPADLQHHLAWRVAAALRDTVGALAGMAPGAADQPLAAAVAALLGGHDEDDTLEGRAMALALALRAAGRLDDDLIAAAVEDGHVVLAASLLALRAGIAPADAWDMLADPGGERLAVLLRAIDCARRPLARMMVALAGARSGDPIDGAALIEAADGLDADAARRAIHLWRLDPAYRDAIADLAGGGR